MAKAPEGGKAAGGKDAAKPGHAGGEKIKRGTVVLGKTASAAELKMPADYMPRLRKLYDEVVLPKLMEEFGYKSRFEAPQIEKIVLNMASAMP